MLLYPTISNMITKMRAAREITAYGVFADDGRYTEERALADRYNRAVISGSRERQREGAPRASRLA